MTTLNQKKSQVIVVLGNRGRSAANVSTETPRYFNSAETCEKCRIAQLVASRNAIRSKVLILGF